LACLAAGNKKYAIAKPPVNKKGKIIALSFIPVYATCPITAPKR
jgi:hypothetical protein